MKNFNEKEKDAARMFYQDYVYDWLYDVRHNIEVDPLMDYDEWIHSPLGKSILSDDGCYERDNEFKKVFEVSLMANVTVDVEVEAETIQEANKKAIKQLIETLDQDNVFINCVNADYAEEV